jgi:peptidoglycan/LPS O-acetylase OafA/YrhL
LPRLESLRGLAALTVAAFHAWQSPWLDPDGHTYSYLRSAHEAWPAPFGKLLAAIAPGNSAVNLFFVLSGFVLTLSLVRAGQPAFQSIKPFVLARAFRIYPAVFATIAVFAIVYWTTGQLLSYPAAYEPASLIQNALLLATSIDGVMWSLQLELLAIPLLLLGYALYRMFGLAGLLVLLAALIGLSMHGSWLRLTSTPYGLAVLNSFVVGMIASLVSPKFVGGVAPTAAKALFLVSVAGFYSTQYTVGAGSRWFITVEACFAAIMVTLLAYGALGKAGRFFDLPIIRYYGKISYSFFLLHPLALILAWKNPEILGAIVDAGVPHPLIALGLFVTVSAATTPLAAAMHRYVELPGIAAGRAILATSTANVVARQSP